jgi:hypothetical protein
MPGFVWYRMEVRRPRSTNCRLPLSSGQWTKSCGVVASNGLASLAAVKAA